MPAGHRLGTAGDGGTCTAGVYARCAEEADRSIFSSTALAAPATTIACAGLGAAAAASHKSSIHGGAVQFAKSRRPHRYDRASAHRAEGTLGL